MTAEQFRIRVLARIDEWLSDPTIGPRAFGVLSQLREEFEHMGLCKLVPPDEGDDAA